MRRALITGITGQDGSYLAEWLLAKGYEVHGLIRRASTFNTGRVDHLYIDPHAPQAKFFLHYGDLTDAGQLTHLIYNIQPEEIYHLGAQSHVRVSFDMAEYTGDVTGIGTTRMLEALRRSSLKSRFYNASSSEIFGDAPAPQHELTPFRPRSPYGAAKAYATWMVRTYAEAYKLYACNGILFNHESPRRGETFVTRKITRATARIVARKQHKLYIGNLEAKRDWGFAPEYVEGMWLMLQQDRPDDYVLGTGESHSVREFLEAAFTYVNLDWHDYVEVDARYFRPAEVDHLVADAAKAKRTLGWDPAIRFEGLIKIMMDYDLEQEGIDPPGEGKRLLLQRGFQWTESKVTERLVAQGDRS